MRTEEPGRNCGNDLGRNLLGYWRKLGTNMQGSKMELERNLEGTVIWEDIAGNWNGILILFLVPSNCLLGFFSVCSQVPGLFTVPSKNLFSILSLFPSPRFFLRIMFQETKIFKRGSVKVFSKCHDSRGGQKVSELSSSS